MYATTATVLLAAITVLAGITAVHAQAPVANDDTAFSNGIDHLAIDILANDTFEGPVSVTVESRYVWPDIAQNPPAGYRPSLFSDYIRPDDILHGLGPAEYNGTHLVYTPGEWAPISPIPALYTYTIRDGMNRSASANVTIHITNPVARAVVSDVESDPKFFVIGYSNDPISGRLLDDDGNIIYNFTGIRSGTVGRDTYYSGQEYDLVPDVGLYAWAYRFPILLSYPAITAVVPGFDPPLEPGTYTYQFARTADADYAGDDVHAGTFTVPEPSEHAQKS